MKNRFGAFIATYVGLGIVMVILNLAVLAGAVWVVVKILQWMGVL